MRKTKKLIKARRKKIIRTPENSRERKVLFSLRELFPDDPYIYLGYHSWIEGVVGEPLQIDIFFTAVGSLANRPLAIEVQGDQHRGVWRKAVKWVFRTKGAFERQLENDDIKRKVIAKKNIPYIEIWPETDITPAGLQEIIEQTTGVKLNAS